jgi:hypothetical protein
MCQNPRLKPFKDTPTVGKCTCGKSWAHASKLAKLGKSACVFPGSASTTRGKIRNEGTNSGGKTGKGGATKRGKRARGRRG